jgi:hypothetical protein
LEGWATNERKDVAHEPSSLDSNISFQPSAAWSLMCGLSKVGSQTMLEPSARPSLLFDEISRGWSFLHVRGTNLNKGLKAETSNKKREINASEGLISHQEEGIKKWLQGLYHMC